MSKASRIGLGLLGVIGVAAATFAVLVITSEKPPARPAERPAPPPEPVAGPEEAKPEPAHPRATPRAPEAGPGREAPDTTPPRLRILAPRGQAVTMTPKLLLRVRSEAGAKVTVNTKPLAEHSPGLFALNLRLKPGRNRLVVEARDKAGNRSRAEVQATFADPSRARDSKDRLEALMVQLDEIQAAAADIDRRIADLLEQMDDTTDAEKINALSQELRTIRNTRRELKKDITRAVEEIDALLVRQK